MAVFKTESPEFCRYIQKFCQLPVYEETLPQICSRRSSNEVFAVLVAPYQQETFRFKDKESTENIYSNIYYYESPQNKLAVVIKKQYELPKDEKDGVFYAPSSENMSVIYNGKKIYSHDYAAKERSSMYRKLFSHFNEKDSSLLEDLLQAIQGGVKIEEHVSFSTQIRSKLLKANPER